MIAASFKGDRIFFLFPHAAFLNINGLFVPFRRGKTAFAASFTLGNLLIFGTLITCLYPASFCCFLFFIGPIVGWQ
jgi:hypothetical protein